MASAAHVALMRLVKKRVVVIAQQLLPERGRPPCHRSLQRLVLFPSSSGLDAHSAQVEAGRFHGREVVRTRAHLHRYGCDGYEGEGQAVSAKVQNHAASGEPYSRRLETLEAKDGRSSC